MPPFKIAAAQVPSVRGDLEANIATHAAAIAQAARRQVSVLIFPELWLTGYEPVLARELAMTPQAARLAPLVALAKRHEIAAVVGAPLEVGADKPALGAIVLGADGSVRTYCKMHLGTSERPWFSPGDQPFVLSGGSHKVGLAICADTSQPSHPQAYADLGADIYAAGVFLNREWYETDAPRLADYAARHKMLTLMANHAASTGTLASVGKSTLWSPSGAVLAQAESDETSLLIATATGPAWQGEVVRM
jgi:predicted amidohydrolase